MADDLTGALHTVQCPGRLIRQIDCTEELPAEDYFCHGDVRVVHGKAGRYRETQAVPLSRFGYRFQVENLTQPHVAVIRYPDDKDRFMIINDGTSYDLSTGLQTGGPWPLSNEMREIRQVFWPRWHDCSIVFMSWGYNQPAAAASVDIYELDELPGLDLASPPGNRRIGIQYEDPCGVQAAEGAVTYEQWRDHLITYMKHTGQSTLTYPLCWYHGPLVPMDCEPSSNIGWMVAPDRKMYSTWTTEPTDWAADMLDHFDRENLEFRGMLTLLRLGTLMADMNIDQTAINGGAETYNNVLGNGTVQAGTGDWTLVYNARNYEWLPGVENPLHAQAGLDYAYGEKTRSEIGHAGPMFNPLHPKVQQAVIDFCGELAEKYCSHKSFKGLNLAFWKTSILWFGSIQSGYDDYTADLFAADTGISIQAEANDPGRFQKRYDYFTTQHRQAWVNWRARKVREFILKIRDRIVAVRDDLELCLDLWVEVFVNAAQEDEVRIGVRKPTVDLYVEGGFDPALYQDDHNIGVTYQIEGGGRDTGMINCEDTPLEKLHMHRDHDYLDRKTLDAFAGLDDVGAFIFNAWHEAWGNYLLFPCEDGDGQAKATTLYGDKCGVCRMNAIYPEDGFWWEHQLRIAPTFPPAEHFLEHYAHALAEFDALHITRGGLFLDKAHSEQLRRFAKTYSKLPAEKFETVGTQTDPVAIRQHIYGEKRYFYLINREYYPVHVDVLFDRQPQDIVDLADGEIIPPCKKMRISLGAYELKVFAMDEAVGIDGVAVFPPETMVKSLVEDAELALKCIREFGEADVEDAGLAKMEQCISEALKSQQWSRLRKALASSVVKKCQINCK